MTSKRESAGLDPAQQEEVDAILAVIAADARTEANEPESPASVLPYQASNDNSKRSWLGWLRTLLRW